ncbi:hypothetical protein HPB49_014556 [Dermacentor silvarum]|uniref:Uncharacterized protein n=1 Tax=Dermacentor silvarum TaxID=543639 RepID=A0ACB8CRJ3_DERSI|nr:hypothetical protein HPB49_014556 [Dermacentor silvarum]
MTKEDICITGISGRYPQADSFSEFKEKLNAGVDFITDDEARWPRGFLGVPNRMGTIKDLSRFDASFFRVPPKQVQLMDPMLRLLLESSYEAIVDAGYDPATLRGRKIGVFVGCALSETMTLFGSDAGTIDGYISTGASLHMFSNRVSYCFDFDGPSFTVDSASSSTMTAFSLALQSLRAGDCEAAIVGGCSIILNPLTTLTLYRFGLLSRDGKSKSFDDKADGYVRSETIGAVFLQRASEARRIYAKVVNVKSNADGYKVQAITTISKAVIVMETGMIPPNLHFKNPNPRIPCLNDGSIEVISKPTPFDGGLVGVHALGFGGTNGHAILEANPGPHVNTTAREKLQLPRLVLMAGRSGDSLGQTLDRLEAEGPYPDSAYALLNRVGQPSIKQFPFRGYALIPVDGSQKPVTKVALVDVIHAVGLRPDGIVGHSLGEIAGAYADGGLSAEQAVLCGYWRGRCTDVGNLPRGLMAAVIPEPKPRGKRWVSSSVPESRWEEPISEHCSAEYFVNNLVSPVLFCEALKHVPRDAIVVEIAPHCLLLSVLRRALDSGTSIVGLMNRDVDNQSFFLGSLGKLHTLGVQLDLSALYPPVPWPVPRGTPTIGHLVSWDHSHQWAVASWKDDLNLIEGKDDITNIDIGKNEANAYLAGHRLAGKAIFPVGGHLVLAWKSLSKRRGQYMEELPVILENITVHRNIVLPETGTVRLITIVHSSGEFEVMEDGTLAASGCIRAVQGGASPIDTELPVASTEGITYELDAEDIYKDLAVRGHDYQGAFRGIMKADIQGRRFL